MIEKTDASGSYEAVVYFKGKKKETVTIDDLKNHLNQPDQFIWLTMNQPSADQIYLLQNELSLHDLAIEDAVETHTRAKLETFGDSVFIVAYMPYDVQNKLAFDEILMFAGKGYVIDMSYRSPAPLSGVRKRNESKPIMLQHGEDYVIYSILSAVIDSYYPILDQFQETIDGIQDRLSEKTLSVKEIFHIQDLRRYLLSLRRKVSPLLEITKGLNGLKFDFIDGFMHPYFTDLTNHIGGVLERVAMLLEMTDHTVDLSAMLADTRLNNAQEKFAAWASIVSVITASAGIYGMNFANMPFAQTDWGFYAFMFVTFVMCLGLYINFKRMRWL